MKTVQVTSGQYGILGGFLLAIAWALLVVLISACSGQMPEAQAKAASLKGTVTLGTPTGPVVVDLGAGIVLDEGPGWQLLAVDIEAEVETVVNGAPVSVWVHAPGERTAERWVHCVSARISWAGMVFEPPAICIEKR